MNILDEIEEKAKEGRCNPHLVIKLLDVARYAYEREMFSPTPAIFVGGGCVFSQTLHQKNLAVKKSLESL